MARVSGAEMILPLIPNQNKEVTEPIRLRMTGSNIVLLACFSLNTFHPQKRL